jgi:hypothetical protein
MPAIDLLGLCIIRTFNKVHILADRKISAEEIARTVEKTSFTVKAYLSRDGEFKGSDSNTK